MLRLRCDGVLAAVLVGGFVAGAIDISYAIIASSAKASPGRVLQSVASGLLGPPAFEGGVLTAALGLVLHFLMTAVMALIFIALARSSAIVRTNFIIFGLAYGCCIYFIMRWVVVPLSRFPGDLRSIRPVELAIHAVGVGLVISLAAQFFGALNVRSASAGQLRPAVKAGGFER